MLFLLSGRIFNVSPGLWKWFGICGLEASLNYGGLMYTSTVNNSKFWVMDRITRQRYRYYRFEINSPLST